MDKCSYGLSSNVPSPVATRVAGSLDKQAFPHEIREVQVHAEIICANLRVVLENLSYSIFLNRPVKRGLNDFWRFFNERLNLMNLQSKVCSYN